MERVVYLLGAGFSAPLGLPVMDNFLVKSKDLYFNNPEKYRHFLKVFETISSMSVSKNYYETDLFNIEEILSILEMRGVLGATKPRKSFIQLICDVIDYYTPQIDPKEEIAANWDELIFGRDTWKYYAYFVCSLQNLVIELQPIDVGGRVKHFYKCRENRDQPNRYSVITLNYDMVLEKICTIINEHYGGEGRISFKRTYNEKEGINSTGSFLAKLHGSIDTRDMVPPTWNKDFKIGAILNAWKLAYKLLTEANHIRVLGYSLRTADAYVKYLLKAAVMDAPHLKSIDVICLDPSPETKKRYDEFIKFPNYRFITANIQSYLVEVYKKRNFSRADRRLIFDQLETAHESFLGHHYP
jgi:hypothetical protein